MVNVVVTAASVAPVTSSPPNTTTSVGTAGATITQGQALFADATASNALKPADATSVAKANAVGIALNAASSGQPVTYATGGQVTFGSGLTRGTVYMVSATAGGGNLCPFADLVGGNFPTIVGIATAAGTLLMCLNGVTAAGVAI